MTDWYDHTGYPASNSQGLSQLARSEFVAVQSAMAKLPTLTGAGNRAVFVNAGGTALESIPAATARIRLGLVIGTDVQAYDADLAALAAFSSTGIAVRTASDTWAQRTIAAGTGIGVTNGDGVSGNPTVAITDAELLAIAGLTSAADRLPYFTGDGTADLATFTAGGRALVNSAGTANTFPYFSASNTVTLGQITAAGRALLDDASAADQVVTLGTNVLQHRVVVVTENRFAAGASVIDISGLSMAFTPRRSDSVLVMRITAPFLLYVEGTETGKTCNFYITDSSNTVLGLGVFGFETTSVNVNMSAVVCARVVSGSTSERTYKTRFNTAHAELTVEINSGANHGPAVFEIIELAA